MQFISECQTLLFREELYWCKSCAFFGSSCEFSVIIGTISVDPIDDSLDELLQKYMESSSDDSDSSRRPTRTDTTSLQSSRCMSTASSRMRSTPALPTVEKTSSGSIGQASSISRISDSKEGPYFSSESDVSISTSISATSEPCKLPRENSLIRMVQGIVFIGVL